MEEVRSADDAPAAATKAAANEATSGKRSSRLRESALRITASSAPGRAVGVRVGPQSRLEGAAHDELHGQHEPPVVEDGVEDLDDVGVSHLRGGAHLALEAGDHVVGRRRVVAQHLQRADVASVPVARLPDDAMPPSPSGSTRVKVPRVSSGDRLFIGATPPYEMVSDGRRGTRGRRSRGYRAQSPARGSSIASKGSARTGASPS